MDCCHMLSDNGLVNEIYFNNVRGDRNREEAGGC